MTIVAEHTHTLFECDECHNIFAGSPYLRHLVELGDVRNYCTYDCYAATRLQRCADCGYWFDADDLSLVGQCARCERDELTCEARAAWASDGRYP